MAQKIPNTSKLFKILETSPRQFLEIHLPDIKGITFHEYLYSLMEKYGKSVPNLTVDACISKPYAYQLINGDRLPGRDIILRIGLSMRLSLEEIQRLLTLAEKSVLYPKIHRDACILYCIRKKMSLDETNFFLIDLGEDPLL